ncbi:MAG: 3-oxoacyl-ACP reductase family protein [Armatimonadota bacterium]|nr:3-oxoacyl-ACP reductase family protein [Armatimonadota bacterium]MDR7485740.1 3-oxoacyl-ACP reductase family protein [Armatimonadota bacterium]MDR7537581.1 3-oxoacyl-ACP reductase family protein [Armatimonadota bacterium]
MGGQRFSLADRTALVTGGSRGLGEAIAVGLAEAGADVAVAARSRPDLERVASRIGACGRRAAVVEADVTRVEDARRMVEETEAALGPLHILVNNAGVNIPRLAVEVTEEEWDRVVDTNLKGVFFCAQAAGRRMVQRRYGRIVNVASQMGLVGFYFRAAYCASKAGVVNLTRVLAVEWAPHGVTVNAVAPTFVETPMTREMLQDPWFRDEVFRRIPAGRLADAQDVVSAVVYLASDAATMVTGHTLLVDGGWVAW